jgi:hypothetical protein
MSSNKGESHLKTLEALLIREHKSNLNTREEWNRRELTIDVADLCNRNIA